MCQCQTMDFPVPLEDQEGFVPCFFYLTNLIDCVILVITMKLLVECNVEQNIDLTLEVNRTNQFVPKGNKAFYFYLDNNRTF